MVVNEYPLYTVTCSQSLFYMPDLQRDIYKTHTSILLQNLLPKMILFTIDMVLQLKQEHENGTDSKFCFMY